MESSSSKTSKKAEAITDWNDAYDNIGHIPNALAYLDQWTKQAQDFIKTRCKNISSSDNDDDDGSASSSSSSSLLASCELNLRYGPNERHQYDLYVPISTSIKGIFIFIHGGYWYRFDKSYFSHIAEGPLTKGYVVAMPSYRLCPNVKVADITKDITMFIQEFVKETKESRQDIIGNHLPIILCGHSAGGHLATRQVCYDNNDGISTSILLDKSILQRITQVISISGVHDLRPILRIAQNDNIQLDSEEEAMKESPALLKPVDEIEIDVEVDGSSSNKKATTADIICFVGSEERPEFIRQNDLLANVWKGMGMATTSIHIEGKHHFNVIDELIDPNGIICNSI